MASKATLHRLRKVEAVLNPPPPPKYVPVDEDKTIAKVQFLLCWITHRLCPEESKLTAVARALQFDDEADLLRVALNDKALFESRYLTMEVPSGDPHCVALARRYCDKMRVVIVEAFLAEEVAHQIVDAAEAQDIWPIGPRPGMSPMRPCRPDDWNPAALNWSDETWSDLGRYLLALAAAEQRQRERQAKRAKP